jgi:tRNA threonylcarbamoyl adenosine modification protein (Sua5/YciO/YrdC/YwlC family)
MASDADQLIEQLRAGLPALLPTDTVYGLVSTPGELSVERLYALKGRPPEQPTALLGASVEQLIALVPELSDQELELRTLLPGPFTLVLPNPSRRFRWLTGPGSDAIGVRVPELSEEARRVLAAVGCVAATSANEPGGPDPRTLAEIPERLRAACPALDGGTLAGTPSTVLDLTGPEPSVLREGASPSAEAIARVRSARVRSG